jgi:hypothetical protein
MMLIDCQLVVVYEVGIEKPGVQFQYQNRSNQTLNNRTITESNRRKRNEQKSNNKLAVNKTGTEWLSVLTTRLNCDCPMLARFKFLCDYGIDNCNPVSPVC